jgi:hypothetical protein
MKNPTLSWIEMAGLALVGGLGAFGISRYMSKKLRVGDVAYVPASSLHMTTPSQAAALDLTTMITPAAGALAGSGNVKVLVTNVENPATILGTAGQGFGLVVPVLFESAKITRIDRAGKQVSP